MAIWNDLAKGASDAANVVAKKTGELTNIAKIKITLKSEEAKLSECFEEIGRLYYAHLHDGVDNAEEIGSIVSEADGIVAKVADVSAELAKLQKSVVCPACGEKISDEAAFCQFCGAKLEHEEEKEEACRESCCDGCCGDDSEDTEE
jgi:hypothetical protein